MLKRLQYLINEATQQNLISILRKWLDPERLKQSINYHTSGSQGEHSSESKYVYRHLKEIIEEFYPQLDIISMVNDIWFDFFYGKLVKQLSLDKDKIKITEFFTPYTFDVLTSKDKTPEQKWKRRVQRHWKLYLRSEDFENDVYSSDFFQRIKNSGEYRGNAGLDA